MSHHFDTKLSKEDPSLNICDMYVFDGEPGRTAMVMTVNADTFLSSPDLFHPEGIYAFRLDLDGDLHEDLVFKFRFSEPRHEDGDEHRHVQDYTLIRSDGSERALKGETLLSGRTGEIAEAGDIRAFVGLVPEMWAVDAAAFQAAMQSVYGSGTLDTGVWGHGGNTFARRNLMAIVLDLPTSILEEEPISIWSTISLFGHAPEVQIYRYGVPLFTHMMLSNPSTPELMDYYHAGTPVGDEVTFLAAVRTTIDRLCADGPHEADETYRDRTASRVCPSVIRYHPGSRACFDVDDFNGRALGDDVADAMWSLATGRPIDDGVAPDPSRIQPNFPYYGRPYSHAEQDGLASLKTLIGYKG